MIYNLVKKLILRGAYDKDDLLNKLDAYLLFGRITQAQYDELVGLMNED